MSCTVAIVSSLFKPASFHRRDVQRMRQRGTQRACIGLSYMAMHAATGADVNETTGPGAPTQAPAGTPEVPTPPASGGFFQRLGDDIRNVYQGECRTLTPA